MISFLGFSQEEINPNGYNVFYYESGEKASEGYFKNGQPHGEWKSYHPLGTLKSIGYKANGQSDSLWKFYDEEGLLKWSYEYENDKKNGCAKKYDSLGNVIQETFYVNDEKQGEEIHFFADGQRKKVITYNQGKEEGLALEYNEEGTVITEELYDNGYLKRKEKFNRYDEEGNKTGVWRSYFDNGNIKTEISYSGGKKEGVSKLFDKDGKLVSINKMKGDTVASDPGGVVIVDLYKEYHENGSVKLMGGLSHGLKSGIFRKYDKEGNLIKGYVYARDTLFAKGMIESGGIFTGEWTTYYGNGVIKSKGSYENGRKNGKWIFYYPNGKKEQEGRFKDDVLIGQWIWYYQNGQIKREEFYNNRGLLEGTMVEYDSLGNELAKGEYYNGQQQGAWFYHVGDFKEVGAFTLGQKDGVWTHYYLNGKVAFIGGYNEGEPTGKHTYYHQNGMRRLIGKHSGGQRHGLWREYNERGEEIETIRYNRGEIEKINGFSVNKIDTEG
ncbi:MAG: toxin-antitoxin system YwqK family antitoxin [Crocinitomicaceae bacterium]